MNINDDTWLNNAFLQIALKSGSVDHDGNKTADFDDWDKIIREAKAQIQQRLIEARIDEAKILLGDGTQHHFRVVSILRKRIAELKAQLSNNQDKESSDVPE